MFQRNVTDVLLKESLIMEQIPTQPTNLFLQGLLTPKGEAGKHLSNRVLVQQDRNLHFAFSYCFRTINLKNPHLSFC
jgi:hypothetical protein